MGLPWRGPRRGPRKGGLNCAALFAYCPCWSCRAAAQAGSAAGGGKLCIAPLNASFKQGFRNGLLLGPSQVLSCSTLNQLALLTAPIPPIPASRSLSGLKWFTSAADGEMSFALGRELDGNGRPIPGNSGLTLFFVPIERDAGGAPQASWAGRWVLGGG